MKKTFSLIISSLLSITLHSTEIENRAASDMDFLTKASKNVKVELLDLEGETITLNIKKPDDSNTQLTDEISLGVAAPVRDSFDSNRVLEINERPVTDVRKLLRRGQSR